MLKRGFFAFILLVISSFPSYAAEHVVRAVGVKFTPAFLVIEPGDSISWTNMPAHLIESIYSMWPEGAFPIITEMGVDVNFTFEVEGIYVYKCTPHWGARMGGIFMVGNPDDIQGTIDRYYEAIKQDPSLLPAKGLLKKFVKHLKKEGVLTE